MTFESTLSPLTITDPETGRLLTARIYTIDGLEGSFSMGQLVFAICVAIAIEREQRLVDIMDEVDASTSKLKTLTDIQSALVDWFNTAGVNDEFDLSFGSGVVITYGDRVYQGSEWRDFLWTECELTMDELPSKSTLTRDEVENLINAISDKMDSLNAINNEQLIQMQSETAKRDQAFDLASNILKSFNAQLIGTVNNM